MCQGLKLVSQKKIIYRIFLLKQRVKNHLIFTISDYLIQAAPTQDLTNFVTIMQLSGPLSVTGIVFACINFLSLTVLTLRIKSVIFVYEKNLALFSMYHLFRGLFDASKDSRRRIQFHHAKAGSGQFRQIDC